MGLRAEDFAAVEATGNGNVTASARFYVLLPNGVLRSLTKTEMDVLFKDGFTWRGAYDAGEAYAINDVVSHDGGSWVCIQANDDEAAKEPGAEAEYWETLAAAGEDGDDGDGVPTLPGSGTFTLKCIDGVPTWVEDE